MVIPFVLNKETVTNYRKLSCSASALSMNGNIQRSRVAPPPSALLNGHIQIYKWLW